MALIQKKSHYPSHSSTSRRHSTQLIERLCLPSYDIMASLAKLSRSFVFYTTTQHARFTFEDKYRSLSLSPFIFIIVIDYVSKRSAKNFGYLTHKGNTQDNSGRAVRSTTRSTDYNVNDLAFADDIALLENDSIHAQRQLDSLKTEAGKVGIEINVQKTE